MFDKKKNCVTVIIPAAGSGARMGGVYKPLEKICDKEIIAYSLDVFQKSEYVKQIIIAARCDKISDIENVCQKYGFTKVKCVVQGGKDRQDSVKKCFESIFKTKDDVTKLVAIHDAARPLITIKSVENAFETALKFGSGVCACKVRDTVKRCDISGVVKESVDRDGLWLVQTPQVFDTDLYHTSLGFAVKNNFNATDDSSLLESAGFKVVFCDTPSSNIKITYPEDMSLAEAVIEFRNKGGDGL